VFLTLTKSCLYILFFVINVSAQAQQVKLLKTTLGSAGGSYNTTISGAYSVNQTIGQSSLTGSFSAGSIRVLQGFQHPYLHGSVFKQASTQTLSVYPNPSSGRVILDRLQGSEPEKIGEQLTISLFNMAGKLIEEEILLDNGKPIEVDYSMVNKGVYLLKVVGKKNGLSSAIIILI